MRREGGRNSYKRNRQKRRRRRKQKKQERRKKEREKRKRRRRRGGGRWSLKCDAKRATTPRSSDGRASRSPFFLILPLLHLSCTTAASSKRDLVNGICAVRCSSCAFWYPGEIKASCGTRACRDEQTELFGAVRRGIRLIVRILVLPYAGLRVACGANCFIARLCPADSLSRSLSLSPPPPSFSFSTPVYLSLYFSFREIVAPTT